MSYIPFEFYRQHIEQIEASLRGTIETNTNGTDTECVSTNACMNTGKIDPSLLVLLLQLQHAHTK